MKKRRHKKSKSKQFLGLNKALTYIILTFSLVVFVGAMLIVSYNLGFEEAKEKQSLAVYKAQEKTKLLRNRLQQTLGENPSNQTVVEPNQYKRHTLHRMKDIKKDTRLIPPPTVAKPVIVKRKTPPSVIVRRKKPKLAIILDDMSFPSEVRQVKALGIKVNFSFFPPTKRHPQTARLAKNEPFYMVHLPLEAMKYNAEEPRTLHVTDSIKKMEQRLIDIKKDFPRLRYVNNHTGSKFTSDYQAVSKLYKAARRHDLDIVDSRTIASTQLPDVYEDFNRKLLYRDVFLDHEADVTYICKQIKLAVDTAVEKGHAIAIGHPRRTTIKALGACKSYFKPVELVYITEL